MKTIINTKEIEYKGEILKVSIRVWSEYVEFYVNDDKQNLDFVYSLNVQTVDDVKKYTRWAIEKYIEKRISRDIVESWDGSIV